MEYFLRDTIREQLVSNLIEAGLSDERAERVAGIPEGMHDDHMRAHALACIAGTNYGGEKGLAFIALSGLCLSAIQEEAEKRGLGKDDFPTSAAIMDSFVAQEQASRQH